MQHINKTTFANLILCMYITDKQKLPFQQKDPVKQNKKIRGFSKKNSWIFNNFKNRIFEKFDYP